MEMVLSRREQSPLYRDRPGIRIRLVRFEIDFGQGACSLGNAWEFRSRGIAATYVTSRHTVSQEIRKTGQNSVYYKFCLQL